MGSEDTKVLLTLPEKLLKGSFIEFGVPACFNCNYEGEFPLIKKSASNRIENFSGQMSLSFIEKNQPDFIKNMTEILTKSEVAVSCAKFHLCTVEKSEGKDAKLLVMRQIALFNYTVNIEQDQYNAFNYRLVFTPNNNQKSDLVPGGRQRLYTVSGGKSALANVFYFDIASSAAMDKCDKAWTEGDAKDIA